MTRKHSRKRASTAARAGLLAKAAAAHRQGRLDDAERGYRRVIEKAPDDAAPLHGLGLLCHATGRLDEALRLLERAATLADNDVSLLTNLGNLRLEKGALVAAAAAYRKALTLDPRHANARYNLASLLQDQGAIDEAIECCRELLKYSPDDAGALNKLGSALYAKRDFSGAIEALEKALALDSHYPLALLNLGTARLAVGEVDAAEQAFKDAIAQEPEMAEAHRNLADILRRAERLEEAERHAREAVRVGPENPKSHSLLGRIAMQRGNPGVAIESLQRAVELESGHAGVWCDLGSALSARGRIGEAIAAFERARALAPHSAKVRYSAGLAAVIRGDMQSARKIFQEAAELMPDSPELWFNVAKTRTFGSGDEKTIAHVASIPTRRQLGPMSRAHLHFALGKMRDDRKETELAFEHYRQANMLVRQNATFDPDEIPHKVEASIDLYSRDFLQSVRPFGNSSRLPVFIFGMPRSGTTLVEQILSSHPQVHGAGEFTRLPELTCVVGRLNGNQHDYPAAMSGLHAGAVKALSGEYLNRLRHFSSQAARITDKLPGNYLYLGFIAALLPNATLIHCRRDPMDVCFSNYTQLFADGMTFSYDLSDLGNTYRAYEKVMAHWREVLPMPMYEVEYETLVADQERISRELVAFCGLEWDARCLRFYDNQRTLNTASNWQVRQPIYKSAVARWKRYEPWLGELKAALQGGG